MLFDGNKKLVTELKKLMLDEGIPQKQVAEALGIKPQSLNTLLNKKNFSFDDCRRILETMGYDLDFGFIKRQE
jgi:transcriptional regulator with XRE-family HTH domain